MRRTSWQFPIPPDNSAQGDNFLKVGGEAKIHFKKVEAKHINNTDDIEDRKKPGKHAQTACVAACDDFDRGSSRWVPTGSNRINGPWAASTAPWRRHATRAHSGAPKKPLSERSDNLGVMISVQWE